MDTQPRIAVSIAEAAGHVGIGRSTMSEAARSEQVPSIGIGQRLLVLVRALEAPGSLPEHAASDELRAAWELARKLLPNPQNMCHPMHRHERSKYSGIHRTHRPLSSPCRRPTIVLDRPKRIKGLARLFKSISPDSPVPTDLAMVQAWTA